MGVKKVNPGKPVSKFYLMVGLGALPLSPVLEENNLKKKRFFLLVKAYF